MYTVSETIENESFYVTGHPSLWIKDDILLWPPPGSDIDRKNVVTPGPDWIPYKCRILRDNIDTFEEALQVEKMYEKHRDSNSFRKENQRKKFKRDHPVNSNHSDLIDVNELVDKIDKAAEKSAPKATKLNVVAAKLSHRVKPYHSRCLQESDGIQKKVGAKTKIPNVKKSSKFEILKPKMRTDSVKAKVPRYINYLTSGKKPNVTTSTITKAQYSLLNGESSNEKNPPVRELESNNENDVPLRENSGCVVLPNQQENFDNNFDAAAGGTQISSTPQALQSGFRNFAFYESESDVECNNGKTEFDYKSKVDIVDDIMVKEGTSSSMHRSVSFEENVLKSINFLKNAQKRADEQRELFEARMIIKWDIMHRQGQGRGQMRDQNRGQMHDQGRRERQPQSCGQRQTQSRGQRQYMESPRSEFDPDDPSPSADDDFEDLDEVFPIKLRPRVEDFEWNLRQNLDFKFRLKSRVSEYIADNAKKTIRLVLRYLIKDAVLERYTWNGTQTKKAFKNLKSINKFLYGMIRENFKKFKKLQYEDYMKQWLKQAKGRQRKITYTYPNRNNDTDNHEEDNDDQEEDESSDSDN